MREVTDSTDINTGHTTKKNLMPTNLTIGERDKFLEGYKQPKITQEEIAHPNSPIF